MSKLHPPVSSSDHTQGPLDAPHVLVEYGDYQCPSCGEVTPLLKHVQKHFGEKLAFVFRNFPLSEMHEYAEAAAETAEFAAAKGKFWEMHDLLYKNQEDLTEEDLLGYAKKAGLNVSELKDALAEKTFAKRVQADLKSGEQSGVNGTPTFFINGRLYDGAYDASSLIAAIEEA
jgi:protein-disulfide isomerase